MKEDEQRIHLLDFIRGLAIVGMVVYHGAFDLVAFYEYTLPVLQSPFMNGIRTFFALTFIVLAGISTGFTRHPIKRAAIVLAGAIIVSIVTLVATPDLPIRYGILHFMGSAMLLSFIFKKSLAAIPRWIGFGLFSVLFLISFLIFPLRSAVGFLYPIGIVSDGFDSADYYPLIPWVFAFFAGTFLSKPLMDGHAPKWVYSFKIPPVNACGRQTLWIFLFHQPVLLGIFWLLDNAYLL